MLRFFRTNTVPHRHAESTTWLELFFDLVYVAILVELGNRLSHDISLLGVVEFALLFIPIWMSWVEPVFYSRRFPTDDIGHRLLTVAYMGVMLSMAFELHGVTGDTATTFLLAYAASKVILALMYARAWYRHPEYRAYTGAHVVVFSVLAVVWVVIALAEPHGFPWWAVATGLGLLAPFLIPLIPKWLGRPAPEKPPVKSHYVLDRFGELTIIVLGEFFLKAALGADERESYRLTTFYSVSLLMISVGVWWLYFDHLDHSSLSASKTRRRSWMDLHYPFLAALAAYGVAGTKVLALAPGEALADEKRLLLCGALAIVLLAIAGFEWAVTERVEEMARKPQVWARIVAAALLVALAIWGGGLGTPLLVISIAIIFIILVGLDLSSRLRKPLAGQEVSP
jgi:low temperature requirement protein LtrA